MKYHLSVLIVSAIALLGGGTFAWAQELPVVQSPAQQAQPQQTPQELLTPQQLNNLVAPIALYPDPLLGQILVASTYPLEIVEAGQWLQRNKNLTGKALMDAAKQQPWDASVQALVAVPDALALLNQDIRWTTDLGNAFLAQQADVMSAVQLMRSQAQANGKLTSTPQQTVTTETQGGRQVTVIEPADPQIIYVPYYDPYYIWGPPVYGFYPRLHYAAFGFGFGSGFNLGFYFGGWGGWGGWGYWGWDPYWYGSTVYINHAFFPHYGFHYDYRYGYTGRTIWAHDPVHRLGVPYANSRVATRFGASMGPRNVYSTAVGSRVYSNRSVGPNTREQPYRNTTPTQRFQGQPQQRYQAPQQNYQAPQARYQAPQQRYQAPEQRYQAPQQRYQAPQQRYQAPQQRYQAPQQRYQAPQQFRSAPRISTPSFSGGRTFSGGGRVSGGGNSRSTGGGGRRR